MAEHVGDVQEWKETVKLLALAVIERVRTVKPMITSRAVRRSMLRLIVVRETPSRSASAAMARSGLYDQVGGGFARYAVDRAWVVPHFEKMLYDNALLLRPGA